MITFRTEIQLREKTTIPDIWEGFCNWRKNARFSSDIEKKWFSQNSNYVKTGTVVLKSIEKKTTIRTYSDAKNCILLIQYIEDEGKKSFTTTVIMNATCKAPILSYTMEQFPFSQKEYCHKKSIHKPRFFFFIRNYIERNYTPSDFRGDPLSFTPNIFVSENIPLDCYGYLQNKYEHTANIRKENRKLSNQHENYGTEVVDETNLSNKAKMYITDTKNMEFIEQKVTWVFVMGSISQTEKSLFENCELLQDDSCSQEERQSLRLQIIVVKKKSFTRNLESDV